MPKDNATRQAEYRQRQLQDMDGQGVRLNMVISIQVAAGLARLAAKHELTKKAMLEKLVSEAEYGVTKNPRVSKTGGR